MHCEEEIASWNPRSIWPRGGTGEPNWSGFKKIFGIAAWRGRCYLTDKQLNISLLCDVYMLWFSAMKRYKSFEFVSNNDLFQNIHRLVDWSMLYRFRERNQPMSSFWHTGGWNPVVTLTSVTGAILWHWMMFNASVKWSMPEKGNSCVIKFKFEETKQTCVHCGPKSDKKNRSYEVTQKCCSYMGRVCV